MNVNQALGLPLQHATLKEIIRSILQYPLSPNLRWTIQGLGILRLYMRDIARLHIWDSRLEYAEVSKMHTHSWRLRSLIVAGQIQNRRFIEHPGVTTRSRSEANSRHIAAYMKARLHCGITSEMVLKDEHLVYLSESPTETYTEGQSYQQEAEEIHITRPVDGTVTLMERQYDGEGGEADVFWPYGQRWVNAKPRHATEAEIYSVTQNALERWFKC